MSRWLLIRPSRVMSLSKDLVVLEYDGPKSLMALLKAAFCLLYGDSHAGF